MLVVRARATAYRARIDSRRFLFQTALPSGAGRPFCVSEDLDASRRIPPLFATSLGLGVAEVLAGLAVGGTGVVGFSPTLGAPVLEAALDAKKVLFTETDLKVVGFFVDEVRECPLSSFLDASCFEASVSDPPLTLTSAELITSSTMSLTSLSTITVVEDESPLTSGPAGLLVSAWESVASSAGPSSAFVCVFFSSQKGARGRGNCRQLGRCEGVSY